MGGAPCRLCRRGDGGRSHAARPRAGDGTEPGRPAGPDGHPRGEVSLSTTACLQGTHWSRVTTTTSVAGWLRAWGSLAMMKLCRREVVSSASMAEWERAWGTLAMMKLWRREVVSSE